MSRTGYLFLSEYLICPQVGIHPFVTEIVKCAIQKRVCEVSAENHNYQIHCLIKKEREITLLIEYILSPLEIQ